ncbi:resolvase [Sulfitobacter sp. JL08]|uniref:recombinase family protein n=1 Tax=Sulfitobacter sp. JL08 TaxID=2070369 RepID=UPI000E0B9C96|nr:recombinase family protein [Sulfitobacter sp. JL08]AXI53664.1 resolvase [Sulfitobacter sp. JL08]
MSEITKIVSYIRVSTNRQGQSGLGLEAQREAVLNYSKSAGGRIAEEFVEIESGKRNNRPQLASAIEICRKSKATLVIAKLDRLARNVHFISGLIEAGVNFRAADMPNADKFMLHVYAAMAEEEGRRISERTKVALRAAKARGVVLGATGKMLAAKHKHAADTFALRLSPTIANMKAEGLSVRKIADRLNYDGVAAYSGGRWHPTTVQRLVRRIEVLSIGDPRGLTLASN